jgi:catalase
VEALANIQRAHNDGNSAVNFNLFDEQDSPSCADGTFKRLMEHLDLSHPDVNLTVIGNDSITSAIREQHRILFESFPEEQRQEIENSFRATLEVPESQQTYLRVFDPYNRYRRQLVVSVQNVLPSVHQSQIFDLTSRVWMEALLDIP